MNRFCGSCGTPAEPADRFCPGCGTPVAVAAPPPPPAPPAPSPAAPPRPEIQWHYSVGGRQQGPVPESVLRVALQTLPPDTLVWHGGLPGWKSAAEAGLKAPVPAYGGFGHSAPGAPAPAAPIRAPVAGHPIPPDLHWVVVLVLSWVTAGLAGLIWAFKQAAFVKKIDPASKAVLLLTVSLIGIVMQLALILSAFSARSASTLAAASSFAMLLNLVVAVAGLVMVFSMRSSIVRHYNSVEPIGLQLSGVMTFFFSILYFQYHFSRIVAWKKTGQLR